MAHSNKTLEFLQKRTLNIIFHGGEYATNSIISNVKTLSHDSMTPGPLAPSGSATE